MKHQSSKWVSALLDGELRGTRRWRVERHVKNCLQCADEYRHLQQVRAMLVANPPAVEMSDSPEFFWSKVKRDIQSQGTQPASIPVPRLSLWDWLGQHQIAFSSVTAALIAAVGITLTTHRHRPDMRVASKGFAVVEDAVTSLPDTDATPLVQGEDDIAVIWVSGLPWSQDIKDMETQYADLDT